MSTSRTSTPSPSASIQLGPDRPSLHFYTGSGTHPVKPPQPGVSPRVIGESDNIGSFVRIIGRDVEVAEAVRLNAYRNGHGQPQAKLNVGLRTNQAPAPGLYFKGDGIEQGADPAMKFWNPEVKGPLFVAVGKYGSYVTNVAGDANVVPGYRAALISAPGELEFARALDHQKRPMEVLLQAHEELRNQPGSFLSKAIVAYPVNQDGRPEPAALVALRTFMTKPLPAEEGMPAKVSMPFQTPKYLFDIGEAGRLQVAQVDGLKSVREGQKLAKAADGATPAG